MSRRAEPHINIRETHPEQADPRPHHVADIQAGDAIVSFRAGRRFGFGIQESTDQMPQRVAAESIHRQKNGVQRQHNCAHANAEMFFAGRVGEPHSQPRVIREQEDE